MKKVLSCLLAVLLLASLSVTAFAAADVVPSVEAESVVPTVSEAVDADEKDVASAIIITDAEDEEKVAELPEEAQKQLEDAAKALEDIAALVEGNDDLKELLDGKEVDAESLFDISIVGDEIKLPVSLKLELVNPDNFAALLHFVDGEATLVESELADENVSFVLEETGAYAVLSFVEAE